MMVTTISQIDEDLANRFKKAVGNAHAGRIYGNISAEHQKALENHILLMTGKIRIVEAK